MKRSPNIELAERFSSLSAEKQKVFLEFLKNRGIDFAHLPISRLKDGAPRVASFAQARQWFLWRLEPHSTRYHMRGALILKGRLRTDFLVSSLKMLIARHAALRSVFEEDENGVLQTRLMGPDEICMQRFELADTAVTAPFTIEAAAQSFSLEPFDLRQGPLLRVGLFREQVDKHVLVLAIHHSIADAWSMRIILDELSRHYAALATGRIYEPPPLEIDYADYAAWQRHWLDAGERQRQLAYWTAYLGDTHPVLQICTDKPRRADARYTKEQRSLRVPRTLLDAIRQNSEANRVTLFTTFLAALHTLLHRYSNQRDIRVGVAIANRQRQEVQGIIGLFVNTQVLRCVFDDDTTLDQVLKRAHQSVVDARSSQDLPFEDLVEALNPEREKGSHPLFQVMMNYQHEDGEPAVQLPDLSVQHMDLGSAEAQFELTLDVTEYSPTAVVLAINYAAELFTGSFIDRMIGHYISILQQSTERPDTRVDHIDFLTSDERETLLGWSAGQQALLYSHPVHRSFETQAKKLADDVALLFDTEIMTYGELNARANQLAHFLISAGIALETKIGVAVDRSFELVVAVLAVLKAGGAIIPLDAELPQDRLLFMVEQSNVRIVLTQTKRFEGLVSQLGIDVVAIDRPAFSQLPACNPAVEIRGSNLAYVIYTSGSTGQPKGVSISHESLAVCMQWMIDEFSISERDTILHKASFSFDVSMWEIFLPLTAGARLAVARPGDQMDPARIGELIHANDVTVMNFVPSMLHAYLQHGRRDTMAGLRHIMIGGEAVTATLRNDALNRLPGVSLHNLYGPTETTIHVTMGTCRNDGLHTVPIGSPIANTQAYVLGFALEPVAAGLIGELYIGGALLGRGYLNRSALTAEKFIANPFVPGGARLYRTGDLVRWNETGQLEYLGRADHQVKIRGRRLELTEIEARLLDHPHVQEALAVASDSPAGPRLVAYVTCATESPSQPLLREWCARFVPTYMVPEAVIILDAFPLNANGKVDRHALPAAVFDETGGYEAPRAGVEQEMAAIWAEELGVSRVGRHANFFDLGGHSLLALRVLRRLNAKWPELALTVQRLFAEPTVAALSRLNRLQPGYVNLNSSAANHPPLLLVHDGWGSVLDYTAIAQSLQNACPVIGVSFNANEHDRFSPSSLAELADKHCEAILEMGLPDPYRIAGWSLGGALALLIASSLTHRGYCVEFVGVIDPFTPHQQHTGPSLFKDQLRQFLAILLPAASQRSLENDEVLSVEFANVTDDASALSLLTTVLASIDPADLHEYAAVGADGLMAMFKTARVLQSAAEAPCDPIGTQLPVHVWWSNDNSAADRQRFGAWYAMARVSERNVDTDHLGIVRSREVASGLGRALQLSM
ncbi:amino acid adenylation domain-containing protein [Pigmentiphaga litoralis]|uniref:amino acid adenylation domain-containing protein n=1 Tax=Pigmentiphaga litoralis TaxID=516702 RepID=UPI003B42E404